MQAIDKTQNLSWESSVNLLPNIGPAVQKKLVKLGIESIKDLLHHFPFKYLDTSNVCTIAEAKIDETVTVVGTVKQVNNKNFGKRKSMVEIVVFDNTGYMSAIFFNQQFMADNFQAGDRIAIAGTVEYKYSRLQINNPFYDKLDKGRALNTMGILPFHPATAGLSSVKIRSYIRAALNFIPDEDYLPQKIIDDQQLMDLKEAFLQIHFPRDSSTLKMAKKRLIFQEFFELQLALLQKKNQAEQFQAKELSSASMVKEAKNFLPFKLTVDQNRTLEEILQDIAGSKPMNRLLLGEVGSGKTIVSFLSCLPSIEAGHQACIMAPTEILASQHYQKIKPLAEKLKVECVLLSSSLGTKEKEEVFEAIECGSANLIIGTHALMQDKLNFASLAFVAVDEQHRFGVEQRKTLSQKGLWPHTLVMTATPIPRSLALTLYGDLDVSTIKELPSGYSFADKVKTVVCGPTKRGQAYEKIRREVQKGHQAYVICPLVDQSDKIEAKAVEEEINILEKEIFPDLRVASIHGKLKAAEKEEIMRRFAEAQIDILVATTLIEVGIDVPNTTVMLIENADRFGLAQLHQLRGRIGRGGHDSVCILFAGLKTEDSIKRMRAIRELKDGFELAEADLQIRGEGQIFGVKQSGLADLKIASITKHFDILLQAREIAKKQLKTDPQLDNNKTLKKEVNEKYEKLISVGN